MLNNYHGKINLENRKQKLDNLSLNVHPKISITLEGVSDAHNGVDMTKNRKN